MNTENRTQKIENSSQRGALVLQVLIFSAVAIIILSGFVLWSDVALKSAYRNSDQSLAFTIAESGIEYYRWHLAHAPKDYKDGTNQPGPYNHPYKDRNGVVIGQFSLVIAKPPVGSTVVTITSTGTITANPAISRKLQVKMAIPSFAKYAAVLNDVVRFGAGTEVFGPIHSNNGIRFDGLTHNLVTSAVSTYDDPDHAGGNEFGVHTHVAPVDPLPPAAVPSRVDVFQIGRQFPVPAVDFTGITAALAQIKIDAQATGSYRGPSGAKGYEVVLKTNDTFDLYKVNTVTNPPGGCSNTAGQDGWGTWTVNTRTLIGNFANPANGLIFLEDDAWVSGQINTTRITVAAGRFPDNAATRASITVNANLLYTNYDGQDVLSLLAQKNINIGLSSADTIRVDAALMAQNGRVGRYYYASNCGANYIRNTITSYGMIGSAVRYGFAYTDGTGYQIRNLMYDANLLYGPPPSFPLTADYYTQIQWSEL